MEEAIKTERYYKVDKALQLVEGTNVAAFWANLVDAYNLFKREGMITIENTMFQAAKVVQAFTGIGPSAQNTARKRLVELGFLKYMVATRPGQAKKTTHYILYPEEYQKWVKQHDYDELRDQKYKELQPAGEHEKLDQWIMDNMTDSQKQTHDKLKQMQNAKSQFANCEKDDLQTAKSDDCKVLNQPVIDTIEIETKEPETTQTKEDGCVYSGDLYPYFDGMKKSEFLDWIIDVYTQTVFKHHPDFDDMSEFDKDRYIGNLDVIDREFSKLDISVAVNFYLGILGYLDNMLDEVNENESRFKAAHMLENLLKFKQKLVLSKENVDRGKRIVKKEYEPSKSKRSL